MASHSGTQTLQEHKTSEVFAEGCILENWPTDIKGIALGFEGTNVVDAHATFCTTLQLGEYATGPLGRFSTFELDTRVAKFRTNELVIVEGRDSLASLAIALALKDLGQGTAVTYNLELKINNRLLRIATDPLIGSLLSVMAPEFADQYAGNVSRQLKDKKQAVDSSRNAA